MAIRDDLREFLTSRRAELTPADIGLPDFGGRRRVAGLRREEVALVAGMSIEYCIRLERGRAVGTSEGVLEGVSRALELDDAESAHLHDLVRALNDGARPRQPRPKVQQVPAGVQQLLDVMRDVPAHVQNGRLDVLATDQLGAAVFSALFQDPQRPANFARFIVLDRRSESSLRDWGGAARQTVAILRAEAGRSPYDRTLSDLVGRLATQSEHFRRLWASHDVREHRTGSKNVTHPVVGDLDLTFEALDVASRGGGLQLVAFTASPGSPTDDALQVLASHAAGEVPAHRSARSLP